MKNQWTVKVKEDKITGDCIIPFPRGLIKQLGWQINDTLLFNLEDDGTIFVKNLTALEREKVLGEV
jgi:hypothetical protein